MKADSKRNPKQLCFCRLVSYVLDRSEITGLFLMKDNMFVFSHLLEWIGPLKFFYFVKESDENEVWWLKFSAQISEN